MMQNLLLQEGDIVRLKNVALPKAQFVKLRPQSKDFLDISNPRAVLEKTLRAYTCLTTGDSILILYNNKRFYLDIMETKPGNAVSVFEARRNPFSITLFSFTVSPDPCASVPASLIWPDTSDIE